MKALKPVWKSTAALLVALSLVALPACKETEPVPSTGEESAGTTEIASATETPSESESDNGIDGKFTVGFGRKACMPDGSVIMSNYGVKRYSTGYFNKIYLNCVAITDAAGETFLDYSLDISGTANLSVYTAAKTEVSKLYGIPEDHIHMPNTHNHQAVALGADGDSCAENHVYRAKFTKTLVEVAKLAMEDRKEATIEIGEGMAEGLTYVRAYIMDDGSVQGDNYNPGTGTTFVSHANTGEPDRSIQLIRFNREDGKDILLMGWRSHNHLQGSSTTTILQGGFPTATVEYLEERHPDLYVVYYQCDAGRLNPTSNIQSEWIDPERKSMKIPDFAEKLGGYVEEGMAHMESAETGLLKFVTYNYVGKSNHEKKELQSYANEIYSQFSAGKISPSDGMKLCREVNAKLGLSYRDGLHSVYHCNAIVSNAGKSENINMHLYAVSIGPDIGLTFSAYEMFDSNGKYIRENSPFKLTMTVCYLDATPGDTCSGGYVPDREAFEYGCYEADRTQLQPGSAEELANRYVEMLKELKAEY